MTLRQLDLSAGREDAAAFTAYGSGFYGTLAYGVARQDTTNILPATVWHLQPWGERLLAQNRDDGKIYEWAFKHWHPGSFTEQRPN